MGGKINYLVGALLDLVFPRRCLVCGETLEMFEKGLCLNCEADLPLTRYEKRSRNPMADKFNELIQQSLEKYEDYSYATALFFYHEGYKHITKHLKYEGGLSLGRAFAARLGKALASSDLYRDVDLVVPVPLHWTRRYSRGYNQAAVIAAEVAAALGAEISCDVLRRIKRTKSQAKLSVGEKAANVRGVFGAYPEKAPAARHILIIDDVFTTGSTLSECHKALRKAFGPAVRISAATLAFAAD